MNKQRKTAIYCRVAAPDEFVIEVQEARLQDYAERQGYTNIEIYSDNGASGRSFNRPELNRLKSDIKSDKIDTVITASLSRIGRDAFQTWKWIESLKRYGVKLDTLDKSHEFSYNITNLLKQRTQEER